VISHFNCAADPHGKELEPSCPVPIPPEKLLASLLAQPASIGMFNFCSVCFLWEHGDEHNDENGH
jgi:hypothetical protein